MRACAHTDAHIYKYYGMYRHIMYLCICVNNCSRHKTSYKNSNVIAIVMIRRNKTTQC